MPAGLPFRLWPRHGALPMIANAMAATATLATKAVNVTPGGEAVSEVRVRNSGTVVDQFTLEVLGDASAWAIVEPAVIPLFPRADTRAGYGQFRDGPSQPAPTVRNRPAQNQSVQGPGPPGRPAHHHGGRRDAAGGDDPGMAASGADRAGGPDPDPRGPLVRPA